MPRHILSSPEFSGIEDIAALAIGVTRFYELQLSLAGRLRDADRVAVHAAIVEDAYAADIGPRLNTNWRLSPADRARNVLPLATIAAIARAWMPRRIDTSGCVSDRALLAAESAAEVYAVVDGLLPERVSRLVRVVSTLQEHRVNAATDVLTDQVLQLWAHQDAALERGPVRASERLVEGDDGWRWRQSPAVLLAADRRTALRHMTYSPEPLHQSQHVLSRSGLLAASPGALLVNWSRPDLTRAEVRRRVAHYRERADLPPHPPTVVDALGRMLPGRKATAGQRLSR